MSSLFRYGLAMMLLLILFVLAGILNFPDTEATIIVGGLFAALCIILGEDRHPSAKLDALRAENEKLRRQLPPPQYPDRGMKNEKK